MVYLDIFNIFIIRRFYNQYHCNQKYRKNIPMNIWYSITSLLLACNKEWMFFHRQSKEILTYTLRRQNIPKYQWASIKFSDRISKYSNLYVDTTLLLTKSITWNDRKDEKSYTLASFESRSSWQTWISFDIDYIMIIDLLLIIKIINSFENSSFVYNTAWWLFWIVLIKILRCK